MARVLPHRIGMEPRTSLVGAAVALCAALVIACGSERSESGVAEGALGADADTAFNVSSSPNSLHQPGALSFDQVGVSTPAAGRAGSVRVDLDFETNCAEMLSIKLEHNGTTATIMDGVGGCRTPAAPFSTTTTAFADIDQRGVWNLEIKNNGDTLTNRLFPATLKKWSIAGGTGTAPPAAEPPADNGAGAGGRCPYDVEAACASLRQSGLAVRCCYSRGWYCGYSGSNNYEGQGFGMSPGVGCQ